MSEYIVEVNENPTVTFDGWNVRCDDVLIQHEKIVRCRDCRWLREDDALWVCDHWAANIAWVDGMKPDGFCAWGERK